MKRTRKWLALLLAMMMVFSLLAVTAAACDVEDGHVHTEACEDVVVARGPVDPVGPPCPICGSTTRAVVVGGTPEKPIYKYVCTYAQCGQ